MKTSDDGDVDTDDSEDLSIFGLAPVEDDEEEEDEEDGDGLFGVWPENWESVLLFMACATQWTTIPISGGMGAGSFLYQGLDYSKVRDTMEMRGVKRKGAMLEDLRIMEAEAKRVLNEHNRRSMK